MKPILHIEPEQRVDVAFDLGQSLTDLLKIVGDITQLPGLAPAATAVNTILALSQNVRRNRQEATLLAERCVHLLEILRVGSEQRTEQSTHDATFAALVEDYCKFFNTIVVKVTAWSTYNWLDKIIMSKAISREISDLHIAIQHRTEALSAAADIQTAQWQAAAQKRQEEDRLEMRERLDLLTNELGDIKIVMKLVQDSVTDDREPWIEFMGLFQEVLHHITDDKIRQDLMLRLWNLRVATGQLPPSIDLHHKEVHFTSQFPIKSGDRYDTYRGVWMEKGDVEIKRLRGGNQPISEKDKKRFWRYSTIWRDVWNVDQGKYFVEYYGVVSDDPISSLPYFVSPWQKNGTLKDWAVKKSDLEKLSLILYVGQGIQVLHNWASGPIVHGDIRAENVLINDEGKPRLFDFSLSKVLEDAGLGGAPFTQSKGIDQSVRWFAPELTTGDATLTTASDIYSFGMLIIEVMTDTAPFSHIPSNSKVILEVANGVRPSRPPDCSESLWTIVETCLAHDPRQRPSIEHVLTQLTQLEAVNSATASL